MTLRPQVLAIVALLAAVVPADADDDSALKSIRGSSMLATIRYLASDGLEGRESGTRGADLAADYLVSRFEAAGLGATRDGYKQRFDLRWRLVKSDVGLTLTRGGRERRFELGGDFAPLKFSELGEVSAPLVFAGYGIRAPEYGWDDYARLGKDGAAGKIVLVFRHEPDEEGERGSSYFLGREPTLLSSLRQKARAAAAAGAIGLIVVDDPLHHDPDRNSGSSMVRWERFDDELAKLAPGDLKRRKGYPDTVDQYRPLGVAAALVSQELLRWLDPNRDWKDVQRRLDAGQLGTVPLSDARARMKHDVVVETAPTVNVLAVLPGSDPEKAKEWILIGGHYDHEGKDEKSGDIYHGADDNASGTAAVLAIAEAFAALPKAPARSVLFAAWAAEEKGLYGSDWFVHHPTVPLEKVVGAINLDMIGRNKESEISVVGRTENSDVAELFDRLAPQVGISLNDDAGAGAGRSDNASLWLAGIPTISLYSGEHDDYHEPSDTAGKISVAKIERVARLAFLAAREMAAGRFTPKPLQVPDGPWQPIAPTSRRRGAK